LVEGDLERRGRLDGLVNNAAIHHTRPVVGGGMAA
jgi:NAD(P)-dependent dehydrogenase (short-subunit alcohol dehydrogenase family)